MYTYIHTQKLIDHNEVHLKFTPFPGSQHDFLEKLSYIY